MEKIKKLENLSLEEQVTEMYAEKGESGGLANQAVVSETARVTPTVAPTPTPTPTPTRPDDIDEVLCWTDCEDTWECLGLLGHASGSASASKKN